MLIDLNITIGYKCPVCDLFHSESLSIFDISSGNAMLKCICGESELEISRKQDYYILAVPCFICGTVHKYKISKRRLLTKKNSATYSCEFSGYEICCVGEKNVVSRWISEYSNELDKIIEEDFEDFFINDSVVFETIEKIKSLEELGKLYCKCGNHQIEIELLSESVELICVLCGAKERIKTVTEQHLAQTLSYEQIVLNGKDGKKSKLKLIQSNDNLSI